MSCLYTESIANLLGFGQMSYAVKTLAFLLLLYKALRYGVTRERSQAQHTTSPYEDRSKELNSSMLC